MSLTLTDLAFVLIASLGLAQQPVQSSTSSPKQPVMTGVVLTSRNGALRDATVQVRDTTTGTVMTVARTNAAGEFAFEALPAGSYAVELVFDKGRLIAASTPARVTAGESVAVVLRLPPVPTIDVDSRLNGALIGAQASGPSAWPKPPAEIGQTARVELKGDRKVEGKVIDVTSNAIDIATAGGVRRLSAVEIRRVEVRKSFVTQLIQGSGGGLIPLGMVATGGGSTGSKLKASALVVGITFATVAPFAAGGIGRLAWKTTYKADR